jgi:transcriptional regulator with XRE-family HTH domain
MRLMVKTSFRESIAERLKTMRELAGLSPEQVSARAGGEVSPSYLRRLEKGENSPTIEMLAELCAACGTNLAKFFASLPDDWEEETVFAQSGKARRRKAS